MMECSVEEREKEEDGHGLCQGSRVGIRNRAGLRRILSYCRVG